MTDEELSREESRKAQVKEVHRAIGEFADTFVTSSGEIISEDEWNERNEEWLPSDADLEYILSLMQTETAPGEYARWIAAPRAGINGQTGNFEYVKLVA